MDYMTILSELRTAVEKDGRTHAAIADAARIHPKTFSAFVNGRRGLSIETVEQLAKALHFEIRLVKVRNKGVAVVCVEHPEWGVFPSQVLAARKIGRTRNAIVEAVRLGVRCGGFHWRQA